MRWTSGSECIFKVCVGGELLGFDDLEIKFLPFFVKSQQHLVSQRMHIS